MQEPRADEVLVLDGEAIWSRATQETSNRLIAAVGSLLDGSQPACFPIENQHLAQLAEGVEALPCNSWLGLVVTSFPGVNCSIG